MVEVIIVIAIIGILATITIPLINTTLNRYNARAEARELMIQFKKAKLAAVKHYRSVYINFINVGTANSQYQIFVNVDRDTNSPHTYDPGSGDILLVDRYLPSDVRLFSTTFAGGQAGYDSRGLPTQIAGKEVVIKGAAGARSYKLTVSQTGNVSVN